MKADTFAYSSTWHCRITTRAHKQPKGQTVCKVGVFLREIPQLLTIHPPPLFKKPLKFITHECILRDYGLYIMYNAWEPGQYSPDSESEAQGQGWLL